MAILGRFSDFIKSIPSGWGAGEPTRKEAINTYLSTGGILKMDHSDPRNPRIIYPDARRIDSQLRDIDRKSEYLSEQLRFWERTHKAASHKSVLGSLSSLADPMYWEHLARFAISSDYKKAFNTVEPPVGRMRDRKWRRMMRMFLRSPEYRERLVEAHTSLIGRKRSTIRKSAENTDAFKRQVVEARMKKLQRERDLLVRKGRALKVMKEWVQ